ncbi:MAG: type II secretion system F family protein [Gemmatimonadota bacterium]
MTVAFRYRAATAAGEVVEGVLQAPSSREAIDQLRRQTLVPFSVEPVGATEREPRGRWVSGSRRDDALATATRTMATLLAGGTTLERALGFASEHAATHELRVALAGVRADVQRGETLASALRSRSALFGALAPALVRAGEESGTLDEALERLADHVERTRALRGDLRAALLYPALMGVVSGIGVLVLLAFVVPRFVAMLTDAGGTLPASTRLLVLLSAIVTRWWWFGASLGVVIGGALRTWGREPANRRRWHAARLGWPVVGTLERTVTAARFTRAFGTLLRGGSGVLASMRVAREAVTNAALAAGIDDAMRAVERGEGVAAALAGTLPPLATQLLAVGEESGVLDTMALRVADTYDAESQRTLRSLVALVEPALIVGFGALVGFVALAMLQAIYSINASVL